MTNRVLLAAARVAVSNLRERTGDEFAAHAEALAQTYLEQIAIFRSRKEACEVADRIATEIAAGGGN